MALELFAAVASGFAIFGLAKLLEALFRRKLPAWSSPAAFAVGILGFQIWADYSWFDRQLEVFPQLSVVAEQRETSPIRPLSYIVAPVSAFIAIDRSALMFSPEHADFIGVRLISMARYVPTASNFVMMDCVNSRLAPWLEGADLSVAGLVEGANWTTLSAGDPLLQRACALREEFADVRGDTR